MTFSRYQSGFAESSHQGTLRMMQQDVQGPVVGTDDRIGSLQDKIELLHTGLEGIINRLDYEGTESPGKGDSDKIEGPSLKSSVKGVFRNPGKCREKRQRTVVKKEEKKEGEGGEK